MNLLLLLFIFFTILNIQYNFSIAEKTCLLSSHKVKKKKKRKKKRVSKIHWTKEMNYGMSSTKLITFNTHSKIYKIHFEKQSANNVLNYNFKFINDGEKKQLGFQVRTYWLTIDCLCLCVISLLTKNERIMQIINSIFCDGKNLFSFFTQLKTTTNAINTVTLL